MFDPKEFCPKTFCNHTGMWNICFHTLNLLLKQERTDGMNLILRSMDSFRTLFQVVASRPVGMMSNTENWKHLLEEVEMMYFVFEGFVFW